MSRIEVQPGQRIKRGDVLGRVGNTGRSTGYHLHYEVRVDGDPVNPLAYILDGFDGAL
jgi:murein DD-endopeptidase MepM/ murein hydrolase activator NlpD